MKVLIPSLLFSAAFLGVGTIASAQETSDTTITIRKVYHLQSEGGVDVDSIVEIKVSPEQSIGSDLLKMHMHYWRPSTHQGQKLYSTSVLHQQSRHTWHGGGYSNENSYYQRRLDHFHEFTNPETRNGEKVFANLDLKDLDDIKLLKEYRKEYKTIRIGKHAYRGDGSLLPGCVPIFIKKKELDSKPDSKN